MNILQPEQGIKVFDIKLKATTAGPSPFNNERTEVFLLGCKKAANGNPCPGCFNSITWDDSKAEWSYDPKELAAKLNEIAPNKYITIGGGEPTDQLDKLLELCIELKKYDFHIMMYTWRKVEYSLSPGFYPMDDNNMKYYLGYPKGFELFNELIKYIDIIVDEEFDPNEKLYIDDCSDGFLGSIGSGNQKIWNTHNMKYEYMRDLKNIELDKDNELIFIKK